MCCWICAHHAVYDLVHDGIVGVGPHQERHPEDLRRIVPSRPEHRVLLVGGHVEGLRGGVGDRGRNPAPTLRRTHATLTEAFVEQKH
jgi:hypothetical protein